MPLLWWCIFTFLVLFFSRRREKNYICSVIYPRQKNLENLGPYLSAFKKYLFSDIESSLGAAFQGVVSISAPSFCIPMQISDSSLSTSPVLACRALITFDNIFGPWTSNFQLQSTQMGKERQYLLPLNDTETKSYCYYLFLSHWWESDAFCNASV